MRRGTGKGERSTVRVGAIVSLMLLAGCRGKPSVAVRIVEPGDGAAVATPRVRVVLEAAGIEIAPAAQQRPGTAHHHLFLNTDVTPAGDTIPSGVTGIIHLGRGQTEFTFDSVRAGEHRVIAVLADAWHVPITPWAMDTVRFLAAPR